MAAKSFNCVICFNLVLASARFLSLSALSVRSASDMASRLNYAKCQYTNSKHGLQANCMNLQLNEVPSDLPENVITLDLSKNNLTILRNESFNNVPKLIVLTLSKNPLSFIESKSFWPLQRLRTLVLTSCNLRSMSPMLFVKNVQLTKVELGFNQLSSVPCEALAALPELAGINLLENKIQSLDFRGCSRWSRLTDINLAQNEVAEIHQSDFLPLQNITMNIFALSLNKIQSLPTQVFYHLTSVKRLRLEGNNIESFDIKPFLGMNCIKELSIHHSRIHQLLPPDNLTNPYKHYPPVRSLDMRFNLIEDVPAGSLWGFTSLQVLRLSHNKIRILTNRSFCKLLSLKELDISYNEVMSLPPNTFACLLNLTKLNASHNSLNTLSPESFNGMPSILSIVLSHNKIPDLYIEHLWKLQTLAVLDISHNYIETVPQKRFSGLVNLKELKLSHNQINDYGKRAFTDLVNLEKLHLSNEKTTYLEDTFKQLHTLIFLDLSNTEIEISKDSTEQFSNMTSLQELRMESTKLKDTDLYEGMNNKSLFTGLFSLKKLRLKGNYLARMDSRTFSNLSNVFHLDMTNSRIQVLRSGVFSPLSSLSHLYLSENRLVEIAADTFYGLIHLSVVYIQNNSLGVLDPTTFAQCPKLTDLYLPGNKISTIKPGTVLPANRSLRLDVSRNPFTCTCSLTWFRQWLDYANISFKHADQTLCSGTSLEGLAKQPILLFHPEDYCGMNVVLIVVLSFTAVLVVMMVILAYNKRWWLNHKLFLFKLAVIGFEEMAEDFNADNYEFHLNLMFQETEEEWVYQVLKPALEERMPHLQNIIYGDDGLHLGMYYINALYDAIDNSFKTILLISNQSINDTWTMTKLRMALEHINDTGLDKVILIFVEDIDDDHLPYLVRLFLSRNKPYMLWTDDEDGQELFWAQFEKSMRANKAINNAIPL